MLLGILRRHDRLVPHLIHDIGHIKGIVLRQPGVQRHDLLHICLCTGRLHRCEGFVSLGPDLFSVELNTVHIPVQEIHDHTSQVIIRIVPVSHIFHRNSRQSQHLSERTQSVLAIIIKHQIERALHAEDIRIRLPLLLILIKHSQDFLDLLFCQRDGLSVRIEDFHVFKLFLDHSDLRVCLIDLFQLFLTQLHLIDIDLRGFDVSRIDCKRCESVLDIDHYTFCWILFRIFCWILFRIFRWILFKIFR